SALHCLTPDAAHAMLARGKTRAVTRLEADAALLDGATGLVGEPETVSLPAGSQDLVLSLLTLQECDDLPGMLIQIRRTLRPDGLFLGAMAGAETLTELRQSLLAAESELTGGVSPRIIPFADVRDAGCLLQRAGFALPV